MRRRRDRGADSASNRILPEMDNEARYHLSSENSLHVRFYLGSLEVPAPTVPLHVTAAHSNAATAAAADDPASSYSDSDPLSSEDAVRRSEGQLYVTAQIVGNGRPLHAIPQRSMLSKTASAMRSRGEGLEQFHLGLHGPQSHIHFWGEWLHMPVLYRSLPQSACFLLRVFNLDHHLLCSTSMHIFNRKGAMRSGTQKLLLWPGDGISDDPGGAPADNCSVKHGPLLRGNSLAASAPDEPIIRLPEDGCLPDSDHDVRFRQGRLREKHGRGGGIVYPGAVHWLDSAIGAYEQALSFSTLQPLQPRVGLPRGHVFHDQPMFLFIETPHAQYPILYGENLYQRSNPARHNTSTADGMVGVPGVGRLGGGDSSSGGTVGAVSGDPRVAGHGISASTWLKRLEENEMYAQKMVQQRMDGMRRDADGQIENNEANVDADTDDRLACYVRPYTPAPLHRFTRLTAEDNSRQWTQSLSIVVDHSFSPSGMASSPASSAASSSTSSASSFSSFSSLSPVEAMYAKLSRGNESRGHANPQLLKPDKSEREAIARIVALPNDDLDQADRQLLWRFRYSLVSESNAIVKFVLIVDWNGDFDEARLGEEILSKWAPIGADSALKLLSARFKQVAAVRRHAIKALGKLPDDELCLYLLQLVQALRYEDLPPLQENDAESSGGGDGEASKSNHRDDFGDGGPRSVIEAGGARGDSARGDTGSVNKNTAGLQSDHDRALCACPLLRFLANRATTSVELATLLHWYLTVETEDTKMGLHFTRILDIVARTLKSAGGALGREIGKSIIAQQALVDRLRATLAHAIGTKRSATEKKVAKLRQALQPGGFAEDLLKVDVVLPLDTSLRLTGIVPDTARMFASATYPMALEWYTQPSAIGDVGDAGKSDETKQGSAAEFSAKGVDAAASTPRSRDSLGSDVDGEDMGTADVHDARRLSAGSLTSIQNESMRMVHAFFQPQSKVKFVYKGGDDMRQDQLVIQLIGLIDRLFKRVNLDLRLTPFKVISTSRNDGLMEFVDGALTISKILKDYGKNIQQFFRQHHPAPAPAKYGINPEVMETFIRSSAGYCVITFVLAIGDRHLENLMIKPTGHLLHIDFGWIFGRDPKPWPSPMRLIPQMVAAMGGSESEDYARFKLYCCQAYHIMRSNAKLICNLLSLMADADIKDLSVEQDAAAVILKVQDRLRLDLVDAASAEAFLIDRLDESVSGIAPRVADLVHSLAVSMRG